MHDIFWNLGLSDRHTSPPFVDIWTHPGWCVICWAINIYKRKQRHPFDAINPFLLNYPGGLLYQIPEKINSSKTVFFGSIFDSWKNLGALFSEKNQTSQKILPWISLPGHGARFRGFGGIRFLLAVGVTFPQEFTVEKGFFCWRDVFFVGNVKFGAMFRSHILQRCNKKRWYRRC